MAPGTFLRQVKLVSLVDFDVQFEGDLVTNDEAAVFEGCFEVDVEVTTVDFSLGFKTRHGYARLS